MLVDTSVWIDYFNGHSSPQSDRLADAIAGGESIALPGLVWTEILLGIRNDEEAARIAGLLDAFEYVPEPNRSDYVAAAGIYRGCRSRGYTVRSTIDCVLAQLCIRDQRAILCKDRDFQAISRCFPLRPVES